MTRLDNPKLKTDPLMAINFDQRIASSGPLMGKPKLFALGEPFGENEPAGELLVHVVAGSIIRQPFEPIGATELHRFRTVLGDEQLLNAALEKLRTAFQLDRDAIRAKILAPLKEVYQQPRNDKALAYKARPLNGIWATAPYLHNGSIPTLAALLAPAEKRPEVFYLGSNEFDPVNVGLKSDVSFDGCFTFRVKDQQGKPIPGNSNSGHEYGTSLSELERKQLLEYLKTL